MAVALVLRAFFALLTSRQFTPHDVRSYFYATGALVLRGQDPLSHLPPGKEWNFLELMPYMHALEIKSGLPWVYAVKIAPIIADVVLVWLVAQLATGDGLVRALQYAVNPLSLLVVSLHGQVEPVALAFALGGVLAAKKDRWLLAGLLLGAGIAAKTWPVFIALAVLPWSRPREALKLVEGAVVVPVLMLLSGTVFLDTHPITAVRHAISYTSFVRNWGWSGTMVSAGDHRASGYGTTAGHVGSVLVVVAVVAVLLIFRRRPIDVRAMVVLCAVLSVTAGFGTQYLMWPLPLMFAVGGIPRLGYVGTATAWAGIGYLSNWPLATELGFLAGLSWLVIATLVWTVSDAYMNPIGPLAARRDPTRMHPEPSVGP
jgi:Glycosyltransferase family 87